MRSVNVLQNLSYIVFFLLTSDPELDSDLKWIFRIHMTLKELGFRILTSFVVSVPKKFFQFR